MAKIQRQAGTTSQIVNVFVLDTTSTTGAGKTGLTNTNFACYYKRNKDAASTAVTLDASSGVTLGTYEPTVASHGAIKEIDSTNMPGLYEFHIPNNALASGADNVTLMLTGTGIRVDPSDIELTATSNQDGVHGGLSALPNTACTTNASLLTSGTGADQLSVSGGKVLLQATQTGVTIPTVTTVTNQLTAAQIATGVWQDATAGDFTAASSIGKSLYTSGNAPGAASGLALVGSNMGSVSSVTAGVTVSTNNDKTGYSLAVAPPTAAAIATAVWQDTTASDFTTASSIGKSLGGAFTALGTSVFTTAALANAPGGGGSVTVGGYASGQDPATLVLGATASSWNTAGTIGAKINSAGAAGDPLGNAVPGSYAPGTAGAVLGSISFDANGLVNVDVRAVNRQLVKGSGHTGDEWGPAS